MSKQIEIITISDSKTLQQQLEQMVNVGWSIKGVVNNNPNDANGKPFVILERDSADDPTINEGLYENEEPSNEQYSHAEPPRKEISISMGS